ncbi:hypothetical protein FJ250_00825, partial [bacterium]|nr:hypothetical protein [bacterium]
MEAALERVPTRSRFAAAVTEAFGIVAASRDWQSASVAVCARFGRHGHRTSSVVPSRMCPACQLPGSGMSTTHDTFTPPHCPNPKCSFHSHFDPDWRFKR